MKNYNYLLVSSDVLPEVFSKVIEVKELLSSGKARNISEAVKKADISRSAFYKYKDYVFRYEGNSDESVINISANLSDRAGVFSLLTKALYENGANILTVNQSMPVNGIASVSLSMRIDNVTVPVDKLIDNVSRIDGVVSIMVV